MPAKKKEPEVPSTDRKHCIRITMTQETDGAIDNSTILEEYSADSVIHVVKTQVFVDAFTRAVNEAVQELTEGALDLMAPGGPRRKKK